MDANAIADVLDLVSRALRQFAASPQSSPQQPPPATSVTVSQWAVTYSAQVHALGFKVQTLKRYLGTRTQT